MDALKEELKQHIINELNLEDIEVSDISNDESLFGEGLGLDSIDALELVVLLEKYYNVKISNPEEGKDILASIDSMTDYIAKNRK